MEGYLNNAAPGEDTPFEYIGITQRAVQELFGRIDEMKSMDPHRHYSVFVSFLQIYNEKVFDLLNASTGQPKRGSPDTGLRIRWTKKD